MKKEELVEIINELNGLASPLDEDGECEFCEGTESSGHHEGCCWLDLQERVKEAQSDA
jgi:hypothetical protein